MRFKSVILVMSLVFTAPAYANNGEMLKLLSAMMMGGGLGTMITSCGGSSGGGNSCQMGTLLAMMGGIGLLFGMDQNSKPSQVRCLTDATGRTQMMMYGSGGQPVTFVQPAPGAPIAYPSTNLPPAYAQNLSAQAMQICQQPQFIGTMNTAFAAPPGTYALPSQLQPVPVAAPPTTIVGGSPVVILPRSVASEPWAARSN
jgi:hypothetical protein